MKQIRISRRVASPRLAVAIPGIALALAFVAHDAAAQSRDTSKTAMYRDSITLAQERTKSARSGAGFRIGAWDARGLPAAASGEKVTTSPLMEGYFQKGLDLHLTLESTATVYWQDRTTTNAGGLLGGGGSTKTRTYILPLFTSLKAFPFTRPGDRVEPYLLGGIGFALGIDDPDNGSAQLGQGVGVKGGTGVEFRLSDAFGLGVGARWQWIRFLGDFANTRTVEGFGADVGITYRYQYK